MGRIPQERMNKALEQLKGISAEDYMKIRNLAGLIRMPRSFLHKTPDDYEMKGWQEWHIPSDDGTPLEAWYIPAKGGESDRLVIGAFHVGCFSGLLGIAGRQPVSGAYRSGIAEARGLPRCGYDATAFRQGYKDAGADVAGA